ncbi:MAG TPA: phosphate ABC transporter substrate-binding protein PstS [Gemmatimonadaceae bacterium]|nr:phosphate ABC transporter substrate-binding protein PstS [Gemmatimonadaceae bacterium]
MHRSLLAIAAISFSAACGGSASKDSTTAGAGAPAAQASTRSGADLTGAGATFPYPLYSKWFDAYATKTGVKINYQSIGSGGGIRQLSEQTVDFGATDAPMSDSELGKAKGGAVLHFPTALGAVVVIYNLPGVAAPLKLTGDVLAAIYQGQITKWNDARIASLNTGVTLPATDILVVHRSDGSGTSYVFTDYLASVSPAWATKPGKGKEVQWPVGLGAKGNEGVAGQVKQTPGALGYAELVYATQNKLSTATMKNAAGEFVAPSIASVTAAAAGASSKLPPTTDYRVSIVNAPGAGVYPISSFTWLLVYQKQADSAKGKKLTDFLRWALTDGQGMEAALDYAPLPEAMRSALVSRLATIQ